MKVLLCLCACIAVSSAGFIGYPVSPLGYDSYSYSSSIVSHPFVYKSFARPLGVPYTTFYPYQFGLAPSFYSYNILPGNVFLNGVPSVVTYVPLAPADGKDKGKKKPGNKKDEKGTKEETTEAPKEEEGEGKSEGDADEISE